MKRKLLAFILISALAANVSACGQTQEKTITGDVNTQTTSGAADTSSTSTSEATSSDTYTFELNGVAIHCDDDFTALHDELGTEDSYFEAASCAIGDKDKVYTYGSIEIDTYSMNGTDYVEAIVLKDDTVSTPEGISIGSSTDDVQAAYGDAETQDSAQIQYTLGQTHLSFILDGDTVSSIQYITTALD